MNNVRLSIDKISVEYHGVTVNFYNQLALSFREKNIQVDEKQAQTVRREASPHMHNEEACEHHLQHDEE